VAVLEAAAVAEADQQLIHAYGRQPQTRRSRPLRRGWPPRRRLSGSPLRALLGRPRAARWPATGLHPHP
jgi:hypothetical protein